MAGNMQSHVLEGGIRLLKVKNELFLGGPKLIFAPLIDPFFKGPQLKQWHSAPIIEKFSSLTCFSTSPPPPQYLKKLSNTDRHYLACADDHNGIAAYIKTAHLEEAF